MAATPALPIDLPSAATASASVKAAFPILTVMLVNGVINLVEASIILAIGWTLSRWVWRWVHGGLAGTHYVDETLKPLIANAVSYTILAITVVAVLGQFGVQTTSLIAVLGAAGLAIGLALQGTLSNVASGVMLLILRPFRVMESIVSGEIAGTVREIGLFRTVLVTDDGLFISIPNSTIFSGVIVNNSREKNRRIGFTLDVDHGEDIPRIRNILLSAFATDKRLLKDPPPSVDVAKLSGITTTLMAQVWVRNADYGAAGAGARLLASRTLEQSGVMPPISYAVANLPARKDDTAPIEDNTGSAKPN